MPILMDGISNTHDRSIVPNPVGMIDAFGRLRVSNPYTLFDSQNRYSINSNFYSNVTGTGSVSFLSSESSVLMSVANGNVIRESKHVFAYQPGKSLFIVCSFCMTDGPTYQRVGYFNNSNGVFVEKTSDGTYIVLRNNGSDTRFLQNLWNTNKCPGLDMTKAQIFWIDIEWLGVGSVRTGFVIDGKFINAHSFHHANRISTVYMTTAILPIRYEIQGTGTMKQICSSVISEGGYDQKLPLYSVIRGMTDATSLTLVTAGIMYPLTSIRLKSGYFDSIIRIRYIDILVLSNDNVTFFLVSNPTLSTPTWTTHANSTLVQVDRASTSMTGGSNVFTGYVTQKATVQVPVESSDITLGRTNLASDVMTLGVSSFTNSAKVCGMISWIEI